MSDLQELFRTNLDAIIGCEESQRAAAKRLEIHHVLLCGILRGKRSSSTRFQNHVAEVYGFKVHELFLPKEDFTALTSFVNIASRLKKKRNPKDNGKSHAKPGKAKARKARQTK